VLYFALYIGLKVRCYYMPLLIVWRQYLEYLSFVVLPENLPCCYRAREGSIRV